MPTREAITNALPKSVKRALQAIETALAGQPSVAISYDRLSERGACRATLPRAARQLQAVGLLSLGHGIGRVTTFQLSDRWQSVQLDDVPGLLAQAKVSQRARRPSAGRLKPKAKKPAVIVQDDEPDEPEVPRYKTPGLAHIKWLDNWREE